MMRITLQEYSPENKTRDHAMKHFLPLGLSILLLSMISLAAAQTAPLIDRAALTAQVQERFNEIADRLQLTPEQRTRAERTVRGSLLRRVAALINAHADGSLSNDEKALLRRQFESERRGVRVELSAYLSDAQRAELSRIQAEELTEFQADLRAQLE